MHALSKRERVSLDILKKMLEACAQTINHADKAHKDRLCRDIVTRAVDMANQMLIELEIKRGIDWTESIHSKTER